MQIDILGIQAFLAVAECGGFGLAAHRLHLSQTAISHRMRKLEETLGVPLLVRSGRGIALTEAGSALLPRARAAVQQLEASCDTIRKHGQNASRWVSLACLPTLAAPLAVPLLGDFQAAYGGWQVRLHDSSIPEIVDLVESGTAAFGLTVAHGVKASLQVEPIADEPFVLACPPGHPMAGREQVRFEDLLDQPLIRISLPSGNSMTIDDAIGPLRERLRWPYEAQRNAMALEMVRGGLGLTIVPRLSVRPVDGVVAVPLAGPEVRRTLAVLTRRGARLTPQEEHLMHQALALIRQALGVPSRPA
ncbi:LysR family transcriptional regulator [Ramlibacter sp. AW1]|uniref:LysR family transcriptional regulator n=1 Tax=Ramlibacter aurantiacus TaxID=2801330 RepID=A0A936ZEY3_9BURK|nr:LysR family transcriptional regulator [Ramlibacter aurantiacus]MBL0419038.1 LysR family transcriptional regulator [Ramlibacter aurantiacus]